MAWLSFVALATALPLGLTWVACRGIRRLWQGVGIVFLLLVVTLFAGGIDYPIGCGIDCGGVAWVDPLIVFVDALLIASILSVPRRVLRFSLGVVAATLISIAIVALNVNLVIA